MKFVDRILSSLESCISNNTYTDFETEKLELKDLSSGEDWTELYRTTCAFLNSQGGIIIIGVKEAGNKKSYSVHGFNTNNESKLKDLPRKFTDDNGQAVDLKEYIRPDLFEAKDFMGKRVCVLYIEKLPEDKKFVMYKGTAWIRELTGDHKIKSAEIEKQRELRPELELARELRQVDAATLDDLDIDRLNDYIQKLNQGMKVETLKADIPAAVSFLERRKFIVNKKPTLLGMLVCGSNLYDFVGGRCQVDGFVESPVQIAGNKKVFKDNIISLLESSIGFVFANISTGISPDKGGSTIFEYPERLIRETVNNALAHRDYSVDRFVNITINPGNNIQIRNPGRFRREQIIRIEGDVPVRRIIPIPKAQNPRLADVLKSFDRWEGKGWGMSSLTNMALENQVDLPYYMLHSEEDIGLFIPKGQILDDEIEWWIKSFNGYLLKKTNGRELTHEQKTSLAYFLKPERLNAKERFTIALTPDNNHFEVIAELEKWNLVYKHPNSPKLYPIYLVDRTLIKTEFIDELRQIYGGAYDSLGSDYKEVLNTVYHFNEYGRNIKDINASQVGDFLFFQKNKKVGDVKKFIDYKRKVRHIISMLASRGFILKSTTGRPSYVINKSFERVRSFFD